MSDDRTIPVSEELLKRLQGYAEFFSGNELYDNEYARQGTYDGCTIAALLVQPVTEEPTEQKSELADDCT